jgi:ADP-heptose:LPS heptosyltransferase
LSLQFDDDSHDILLAKKLFGTEILKVDGINLRDDLDQTASLCTALAGVIAPSTTTAHLSGSVGTKTIIMDRTITWSPMINNNQDAVIPSIKRIFPPTVDDWKWNFEKARSVVKGWLKE